MGQHSPRGMYGLVQVVGWQETPAQGSSVSPAL